jgi:glyoxylase-like metal-dependent hydrolase (beta-lactamase superfamily II)
MEMVEITRRSALAGASVAIVAAPVTRASAAAPQAGTQAPGFYRYKIGDIEMTTVNDGVSAMPIEDGFVRNVPKAEVNAFLESIFRPPNIYSGPYNPVLVNNGRQLALIDTGTGEAAFAASKGLNGRLLMNLAAAGVDPASIDLVILSHYHGDHMNGLIRADNSLAFPNAEILVPEVEHNFWMDDGEMSRAASPRVEATFKNARRVMTADVRKRVRPYAWGQEIMSGVTAMPTPGHTPGHTSHVVSSGAKSVYLQADVTHAPFLFARNPGWHFMLDVDPVAAEATRRKVYDMLAADRMMVQGFHYPFPAAGHVEKTATGYREEIVQWSPVLS